MSVFSPIGAQGFFSRYWGISPVILHHKVEKLGLSKDTVYQAILNADGAFTTFHKDNKSSQDNRGDLVALLALGQVNSSDLDALVNRQALIVRGAHRYFDGVERSRTEWAEFFRCRVHTNLYITAPSSSRFGPHHDGHHVIALQVEGCKQWSLWRPLVEAPMHGYFWNCPPPTSNPVYTFNLCAGDALYIPLGWVHDAIALDSTSMHVTVGIHPPRWIDVIHESIEHVAAEQSLLRSQLPAVYSNGHVKYETEDAELLLDWLRSELRFNLSPPDQRQT